MQRTREPRVHRCPACAAPLEVVDGAAEVHCSYCHAHVTIERGAKANADRAPPPQRGGEAVLYVETATRAVSQAVRLVAIVFALGTLVALGIGWSLMREAPSSVGGSAPHFATRTASPDQSLSLPGRCAVNQRVLIEGKTLELDGVALVVDANCKIEFRNCHITADKVVEATSANVQIKVVESTLIGRKVALDLSRPNPKVEIDAKSLVQGATAIAAGHNLVLTISGGAVVGERSAVATEGRATIKLEGGKITGARNALTLGGQGDVFVSEGGTIEAKEAITSDSGVKLRLDSGTIRAGRTAVRAARVEVEATGEGSRIEAPTAIETKHNATVELREGAAVKATRLAIDARHSVELELEGGAIRSEKDGVKAGHSFSLVAREGGLIQAAGWAVDAAHDVDVVLESSRIESGTTALKGRRARKLEVDDASEIVGAQVFRR